MKILALDLGKFKTVACMYEKNDTNRTANGEVYDFTTVETLRCEFTKLIKRENADVLVFETCTAAGWLADLCDELRQPLRI